MPLLSSILEVFAVWANKTFIEMPRRLLHVKDGRPENVSGPVGMDLFEAGSICVNLRLPAIALATAGSSAVGFCLRSLCSLAANPFCTWL
jgi:hypothetical protein